MTLLVLSLVLGLLFGHCYWDTIGIDTIARLLSIYIRPDKSKIGVDSDFLVRSTTHTHTGKIYCGFLMISYDFL